MRVRIAGRVMTLRHMGKAGFAHLQQNGERLQIYVKKDAVGERDFQLFKLLDIGDIIGVEGYLFRTRTGELSVHAEKLEFLSQDAALHAGEVARPGGRGDALPPALPGPDRQPGGAQGFRHAGADHLLAAAAAGSARVHRSGNAHDAAALRRRRGAAVRHASQHAGYRPVPAHRAGAVPEAAGGGRPGARLRDQPQLPQRGALHAPQPRVHHAGVLPGLHGLPRADGPLRGAACRRRRSTPPVPPRWSTKASALDFGTPGAVQHARGGGRISGRATGGPRWKTCANPEWLLPPLRQGDGGRSADRYLRARRWKPS